ncbi:hypothetical protein CFSAN002367_04963 [Clostridium botulinum CFSAN002367]|nr:hypothetical protein CFSAN002367_04963 [Clostridium botulinum CFSAN002367]
MVTINSILSFEMQKSKYDPKVWGICQYLIIRN